MKTLLTISLTVAALTLSSGAQAIDVGQTAPEFTMTDLGSFNEFSLSDHEGKVVVLIFFAHW